MSRLTVHVIGLIFVLAITAANGQNSAGGDEPTPKERDSKTYTVSCKLTRKLLVNGDGDKPKLETVTSKMVELSTLEGSRGEYHNGGKLNDTPYGFQLHVEVRRVAGDKVRFKVSAEDSETDGRVVQTFSQRAVRQIRLGQAMTLALDQNERGEGIWVELIVREACE